MRDPDERSQKTSTAVPRFEVEDARGRQWSLRGLSSPRRALRFFRIALELGAATDDDVRQWALAFSRASERVPAWVWDVLDPAIPVEKALRDKDPIEPTDANVRIELEVLAAGLRAGVLSPEVALERIHERRWQGDFEWYEQKDHVACLTPQAVEAQRLAQEWAKEKLHRELDGGHNEAWSALAAALEAFLEPFARG